MCSNNNGFTDNEVWGFNQNTKIYLEFCRKIQSVMSNVQFCNVYDGVTDFTDDSPKTKI